MMAKTEFDHRKKQQQPHSFAFLLYQDCGARNKFHTSVVKLSFRCEKLSIEVSMERTKPKVSERKGFESGGNSLKVSTFGTFGLPRSYSMNKINGLLLEGVVQRDT